MSLWRVDEIQEFTPNHGVLIDGMLVKDGKIAWAAVDLTGAGPVTFPSTVSVSPYITTTAAAGTSRGHIMSTGASTRWFAGVDSTAESGANAGAKYQIVAYDDAGVLLTSFLTIARDTKFVTWDAAELRVMPTTGQATLRVKSTSSQAVLYFDNGLVGGHSTIFYMQLGAVKWGVGMGTGTGTNNLEWYNYTRNGMDGYIDRTTGILNWPQGISVNGISVVSGLIAQAGSLYPSTPYGIILFGKTGTTGDFLLANGAGANVMSIIAGTTRVDFAGLVNFAINDGFAVGSLAGRRRITATATEFSFVSDADGYASIHCYHLNVGGTLTLSSYPGGGAVTFGAPDSGGSGFRMLRIPN